MYGIATIAPGLEEPLEALQACHRRIEAQLGALEKLPGHLAEQGSDATAREAARFAVRYFDTSARDHERDEEEDLFPLLRRCACELQRAEISAVINELEAEHAAMHVQWSRMRERLDALAQGRTAELRSADVDGFAWLYRRHMERESAIVLPFAKEVLSTAERAALAQRMAARRRARV